MKTIMIVEDDLPIVRVLMAYLQKAGYSCMAFARGNEALEQLASLQPALIVLESCCRGWMGGKCWARFVEEPLALSSCLRQDRNLGSVLRV